MENVSKDLSLQPFGKLTIVIGLPGAGKSTYIKDLVDKNTQLVAYDDYQGQSYNKDSDPRLSLHFGPLIADLRQGKEVIVADIRYCIPRELNVFLGAILSAAPNIRIEFKYFENNPDACRQNILARNRETASLEIEKLEKLSANYSVPTVETIPVWAL